MTVFSIGGVNFGINESESQFEVIEGVDGPRLHIQVVGDKDAFDRISDADESEWSWALYPPKLCIVGLPVERRRDAGGFAAEAAGDPLREYDAALYMMEHNELDSVAVTAVPGASLRIVGRVDLLGDEHGFVIEWHRAETG